MPTEVTMGQNWSIWVPARRQSAAGHGHDCWRETGERPWPITRAMASAPRPGPASGGRSHHAERVQSFRLVESRRHPHESAGLRQGPGNKVPCWIVPSLRSKGRAMPSSGSPRPPFAAPIFIFSRAISRLCDRADQVMEKSRHRRAPSAPPSRRSSRATGC